MPPPAERASELRALLNHQLELSQLAQQLMAQERTKFVDGCEATGYGAALGTQLFDIIEPFADYAFNKAHSAAYGLVSYWTAYLKANYPAEYMAGLLTSVGDDKDKAAVYLADCRRLGITVLPPDVNESVQNFASVGNDIRFGLGAVRNVGANVVASLVNTRSEKGKYTDFSDYLNKIDIAACNKKVTESLVKAGAFEPGVVGPGESAPAAPRTTLSETLPRKVRPTAPRPCDVMAMSDAPLSCA